MVLAYEQLGMTVLANDSRQVLAANFPQDLPKLAKQEAPPGTSSGEPLSFRRLGSRPCGELGGVTGGDGITPVPTKSPARNPHARGRLPPLILGPPHHLQHPGNYRRSKTQGPDLLHRPVLQNQRLQNGIKHRVGRQGIAVLLIRAKFRTGGRVMTRSGMTGERVFR